VPPREALHAERSLSASRSVSSSGVLSLRSGSRCRIRVVPGERASQPRGHTGEFPALKFREQIGEGFIGNEPPHAYARDCCNSCGGCAWKLLQQQRDVRRPGVVDQRFMGEDGVVAEPEGEQTSSAAVMSRACCPIPHSESNSMLWPARRQFLHRSISLNGLALPA
jgi:hypothetical protein